VYRVNTAYVNFFCLLPFCLAFIRLIHSASSSLLSFGISFFLYFYSPLLLSFLFSFYSFLLPFVDTLILFLPSLSRSLFDFILPCFSFLIISSASFYAGQLSQASRSAGDCSSQTSLVAKGGMSSNQVTEQSFVTVAYAQRNYLT
jgi:hypothetical protein